MSLVNLSFSEMTNFKCFLSADIFSVRAMHWLRSNERRDSSFSRHYAFHRPMPKLNIENNRLREFLIIANRLFREVFGHSLTLRNDRAVGAKASHVRRLLCDVISFEPELERLAKEEWKLKCSRDFIPGDPVATHIRTQRVAWLVLIYAIAHLLVTFLPISRDETLHNHI